MRRAPRRRPIAALLALALAAGAPGCATLGLRPGDRALSARTVRVPAPPEAVRARALEWLRENRYALLAVTDTSLTAERAIPVQVDSTQADVLELTTSPVAPGSTIYGLRAYTAVVVAGRRRPTDDVRPAAQEDLRQLEAHLSCAVARWPGCP